MLIPQRAGRRAGEEGVVERNSYRLSLLGGKLMIEGYSGQPVVIASCNRQLEKRSTFSPKARQHLTVCQDMESNCVLLMLSSVGQRVRRRLMKVRTRRKN